MTQHDLHQIRDMLISKNVCSILWGFPTDPDSMQMVYSKRFELMIYRFLWAQISIGFLLECSNFA
jgi:hypothetical protein